ncbi:MAG: hypothetical protein A3I91_00805 [Candidatus Kerfeldbacteria bacterium RIFCSPLOWO2_02_FULL_42_19]|nr:MAG: hypothetical protein A3E60_01470 [Candidatus Kerfeldbacteria bacterium RIFCSPHIGHO2_12_FULL_42_13]OGY85005.1 MAG: hypothetical protein A3I91_00805 [Candidatus Kerfeldbacteria bacterium RIFCSPLOWO2_02_FULL_42_19]OGY86905.1 MAG: hypothetical protein A3G01_04480 [Candidatus Kerfeldbacteria bacterium RIFCSPLOWO2_12_FULL_43_9]
MRKCKKSSGAETVRNRYAVSAPDLFLKKRSGYLLIRFLFCKQNFQNFRKFLETRKKDITYCLYG